MKNLYPIVDVATLGRRGIGPIAAAEGLLEGGVDILQLRHKGPFTREMWDAAKEMARLCEQAGCRFVVDDRADIALLLHAGVHVGQEDLPPSAVRGILGAGGYIGFSTHNEAQLRAGDLEPVDYLALGPIFATGSKANPDPVVGVSELRRLRNLTRKPLVAIGGITRENAPSVLQAGADAVAVIGDLFPENGAKVSIRQRTEEWLAVLQ